jgi:hypothetical protein
MRLHESHDKGACDINNNTITTLAASHTTNARFVTFVGTFVCPAQQFWLPGNDLQDSASRNAPSLCQLKSMHEGLHEAFKRSQVSPRRLPAPRTSSPLGPAPFRRNAVSRSSSPSNDPNSSPCVVTASAGQRRGDVEIRNYLRDQTGSRSLVFDLSITHDRYGSICRGCQAPILQGMSAATPCKMGA